jgi:putative ATPase
MTQSSIPLAARMRPRHLDEVTGQDHVLGERAAFRLALEAGQLGSVLLWGPPGCGKTSIARLLARHTGLEFRQLSAVTSGTKELREVIAEARRIGAGPQGSGSLFAASEPQGVLLFVDEIHRWNKAQQDALLPHVEEGVITLVGATTENPAFQVIPALRSRCWLLQLQALEPEAIEHLLQQALSDTERGLGARSVILPAPMLESISQLSSGDARRALSILERVVLSQPSGSEVDIDTFAELMGRPDLLHDRDGDAHYDVVSAFIKSMRGSDPDASLYWMARMLEGGEDPMFIARRLVIFASEDVGNADPRSLPLAVSAMQAVHLVGMPEAELILSQACTWLACAPKSNASTLAIGRAKQMVRRMGAQPVPPHLRNAPTELAKELGHGAAYRLPHDFPHHIVAQEYLPTSMRDAQFYKPTHQGAEKTISDRLKWWREQLESREQD